jgi:hypothetical protein
MVDFPQSSHDDIEQQTSESNTKLRITHGPFSRLHIESKYSEDARPVTFTDMNVQVVGQRDNIPSINLYMPKTEEVLNRELNISIERNSNELNIYNEINSALKDIMPVYKDGLYGEYLPGTTYKNANEFLGIDNHSLERKSVNPALFITDYALKKAKENPSGELVFHPDILFFMAQGRVGNLTNVLTYLNRLSEVTNQKIFIENLKFENPVFLKAFRSFVDPNMLYNYFKDYKNIGITIDLDHLEAHTDKEVTEALTLGLMNNIPPERIIIHSRPTFEDKYKTIHDSAVRYGIPWVVEPN